VNSNFPFVTTVGDRCSEEKHVFIASKALENAACNFNKTKCKKKTDFSMRFSPDQL
jgi:hypothetical protein